VTLRLAPPGGLDHRARDEAEQGGAGRRYRKAPVSGASVGCQCSVPEQGAKSASQPRRGSQLWLLGHLDVDYSRSRSPDARRARVATACAKASALPIRFTLVSARVIAVYSNSLVSSGESGSGKIRLTSANWLP
jgi:hypothetical protein